MEGKGALILADADEVKADLAANMKGNGWKMTAGGIVVLFFAVMIGLFLAKSSFMGMMTFIIGLLGFMFLFLGVAFVAGAKKIRPSKIYENGIESCNVLGKELFTSWGMVTTCDTQQMVGKSWYQFKNRQGLPVGIMSSSTPGVVEAIDRVRPKFGSPEYITETKPEDDAKWKKYELIAYVGAILLAVIVSILVSMFVSSWQTNLGFIIFACGLMGMLSLTYVASIIVRTKKQRNVRPGLNLKVLAPMILCMFVLSQTWVFGLQVLDVSPDLTHMKERPFIGSTSSYYNFTGVLDKPLVVAAGATMTIENSTLSFDGNDGMLALWVEKGGTITIQNSTFQGPAKYSIQIGGRARMLNSMFDSIWGDKKNENGIGGIEIYSDDVLFSGCTISNSTNQGVLTIFSSPVIESSRFRDSGDEGIEVHGGSPKISNSTFTKVKWGIIVWRGSGAVITNNVFHASEHGVYSEFSHPVIRHNIFYDSKKAAIAYDGSKPDMADNEFHTDTDVIEGSGSIYDSLCTVSSFVVLIVCLAIVVYLSKKK